MDRDQLVHLCGLARLSLEEGELEAFEAKFNSMLAFTQTVLSYEAVTEGHPLALIEKLELRRDVPDEFSWPDGTAHDYKVPMVIDFEAGGEG